MTKIINSIFDISNNYDNFILDLWGVIHDGITLYPNVLNILQNLKDDGKNITFLSNAPRRSEYVAKVLVKFGITADIYDAIITSGEATFNHLKTINTCNYYFLGPDKDKEILQGLPHKISKIENAKFILNLGFEYDFQPIEELQPLLKSTNIPMICVNPDIEVVRRNGDKMLCAGKIAQIYADLGGKVRYFGKPYSEVYKMLNMQGKSLAVGDSMSHDILGANKAGIDSLFIAGGISKDKLLINNKISKNSLQEICEFYKAKPNFASPSLSGK